MSFRDGLTDRAGWRHNRVDDDANSPEARPRRRAVAISGEATREQEIIQMPVDFVHAVVDDGVDVDEAHRAFCAIDEYQQLMERTQ